MWPRLQNTIRRTEENMKIPSFLAPWKFLDPGEPLVAQGFCPENRFHDEPLRDPPFWWGALKQAP